MLIKLDSGYYGIQGIRCVLMKTMLTIRSYCLMDVDNNKNNSVASVHYIISWPIVNFAKLKHQC